MDDIFHLPTAADPEPQPGRLLGVCGWAGLLGLVGVMIGIRAWLILVGGTPPIWYAGTTIILGLLGIAFTAGAFLSMHRRFVPWVMLAAATVPLVTTVALTSSI